MSAIASTPAPVVVIGAGLAGLNAARLLHGAGVAVVVLEGSDGIGGRVRTDEVEGFRLDRGFQVLLTAYPEARAALDFERLRLARFKAGALVRCGGGRWAEIADPLRHPGAALGTALAPVGTLADKLRVLALRRRALHGPIDELWRRPERTSEQYLREMGFSTGMIDRFFRPFFGGIFLERELATSSRMLEFVYRMFSCGWAALPAGGMGALAQQLAAGLPAGSVRLGAKVQAVLGAGRGVRLEGGEQVAARAVVIATEGGAAPVTEGEGTARAAAPREGVGWGAPVRCVYFASDKNLLPEGRAGYLLLNGEGAAGGPINNTCVPSAVAEGLAPVGQHLISATVLGGAGGAAGGGVGLSGEALVEACRAQLRRWFPGLKGAALDHLRTYEISRALPKQTVGSGLDNLGEPAMLGERVWRIGDGAGCASQNTALRTGRLAAEALLAPGPGAAR